MNNTNTYIPPHNPTPPATLAVPQHPDPWLPKPKDPVKPRYPSWPFPDIKPPKPDDGTPPSSTPPPAGPPYYIPEPPKPQPRPRPQRGGELQNVFITRTRLLYSNNSLRNEPEILKKKKSEVKIIPLNIKITDTGRVKHYTPATQEWSNSIYAYNNNYMKLLPTADKNLIKLLKSYFTSSFKKKTKKTGKVKRVPTKYRRASAKRVFVGKGNIKHTNSSIFITFFLYDTERKFFLQELAKLKKELYFPRKLLNSNLVLDIITNEYSVVYNRPKTLKEFLSLDKHYIDRVYIEYLFNITNKINLYFNIINKYYNLICNLIENKIIPENYKLSLLNNSIEKIIFFKNTNYKNYLYKVKLAYLNKFIYYSKLLKLSQLKLSWLGLLNLKNIVKNIYNKQVEFNIVSLREMHFNSDIFTQAIALKLKNRDNRLYRVLRSSLIKIKIKKVNRITGRHSYINKDDLFDNKIRNNKINTLLPNKTLETDPLNILLLNYLPLVDNKINKIKSIGGRLIRFKHFILQSLKHINMAGARVEAKGRLTRRFTASRSVFKLRWKGGLKNVDSSFKGLSAVILRGHAKSNVQFSVLSSKNRNGAYGVKGWISNK